MFDFRCKAKLFALTLFLPLCFIPSIRLLAEPMAKLYSKQGSVQVRRSGTSTFQEIALEQGLDAQDTVRTGLDSRAALLMSDGVMVRLNQNSVFELGRNHDNTTASLNLASGTAHFLSRKPKAFPQIRTPLVTASIRGTEFIISSVAAKTLITVLQGQVFAEHQGQSIDLTNNEEVLFETGQAPAKRMLLNPLDAVQWAIYYPALLTVDDFSDFTAEATQLQKEGIQFIREANLAKAYDCFFKDTWVDHFGRALIAYQRGESESLNKELESLSKSNAPSVLLFRSALYLSRGQVEKVLVLHEAAERALAAQPANIKGPLQDLLISQRIIMALYQNRLEQARTLSNQALNNAELSVSAALTRSYVEQAEFQLDQARATIELALAKYPNDALLRTRRAELLLSFGDSSLAFAEAKSASQVLPYSAYAHTIRGFAELGRGEIEAAESAFNQAISLSDGSGLPFLGLGLALIRQGKLDEGKERIQQAVHLEPQVALYRSYLGKALFEQDQEALSEQEFDRAVALDPRDPTPYLYRAFERLSTHRPVAALEDIEKSIQLNDNRAVYRSRLLLDQDNSVRSSSLAQVYQQLGFAELSKIEAINSLGLDYSNYSAHLLLSQSYEQTDELFQASISEFLLARLLSPVNFNLVRPNQSSTVSANEYTALFDRDQSRTEVQVTGQTRDQSVISSVLESGTSGNLGYALSYEQIYSDGYRENDRNVESIVYGSLSYQLGPDDTLLLDTNVDVQDGGDTTIGYDPLSNDPDSSQELQDYIGRVGFNHRFSPGNQFIAQVLYNNSDLELRDPNFPRPLFAEVLIDGELIDSATLFPQSLQDASFRSEGLRFDAQYIFDNPIVSFVFGAGGLESSLEQKETGELTFEEPLPDTSVGSSADNTERSLKVFDYTTFHLFPWLDLQGGVTYSRLHISGTPLSLPFSEDSETIDEWSPKVGIVLRPGDKTTIRGAYFESLGLSGIRELEYIEPTIVGGFNQLFSDIFPATRARSLGLGVDHKLSSHTFIGAEGLRRHVIRPFNQSFDVLSFDGLTAELIGSDIAFDYVEMHSDEDSIKTYIYQVLAAETTGTIDYAYIDNQDTTNNLSSQTHRTRFGVKYFHQSGFIAFADATWRTQNLSGFEESVEDVPDGTENFWLANAGIGYRFSHRHGQVSLALTNILDQRFSYMPTSSDPIFFPSLGALLNFSYNF